MNIKSLQRNKKRRSSAKPERMGALATLPVFYKLQGKPVLLAGGSDAAAWKAELLAASGAHVHIYADALDPVFEALIAQPGVAGRYTWHQRPWDSDCFKLMQMAICDAETQGEAHAFYCAARKAGVPVNVIDKPAFCEFQFGSIVNRSPAVISISTDGAAPILGQAIRRRIETLIAPSIAPWAQLAKDVRSAVNERLKMGAPRRAFWEKFVDRAFAGPMPANAFEDMVLEADAISCASEPQKGKVTLVGAGPGDAELLTLKAVRALQAADVILFDDLVSNDVLELARREAKRMLVGKRGGRESCKQEDINSTMIALAKAGKNVVRLKGGDPMIFGRAGEEIADLHARDIAVSVVPGITSALAMAAELGVSLTHRDHAQSVRFVTGHSRKGELPADIDWAGIADPKTTTIFYMGGRTAGKICQTLTGHGLSVKTPVVVSQSIGRDTAKRWTGTLSELENGVTDIGYDQPVLIGIGAVFQTIAKSQLKNEVPPLQLAKTA